MTTFSAIILGQHRKSISNSPSALLPMAPSPPSEMEANLYYVGLPSRPFLVARNSTIPWKAPTGPEAYCDFQELRAVGNHALKDVWEDSLALELHALLKSM